jgi:hypothetical protein
MKIEFTRHALERMNKRGVSKDEVISVLTYPETTLKKDGKFFMRKNIEKGNVEVVCVKDSYIKVVTVYFIYGN